MKKSRVFILLITNALLVIVGYALAIYTAGLTLEVMQWIKNLMLLVGIVNLLTLPYCYLKSTISNFNSQLLFGLFLLLTSLYAENPFYSISRTLSFLLPFIYVYFSIAYLIWRFTFNEVLNTILSAIHLIYCIPLVSIILLGQTLPYSNIYYLRTAPFESFGFASNQYGWAGCIVLVTGLDLLRNSVGIQPIRKWFLILTSLLAVYLILVSGNRTSWLVLVVCMTAIILFDRRASFSGKVFLLGIPLALTLVLTQLPDSSISNRIEKTYTQLEHGESRWTRTVEAIEYANVNQLVWMIGWGMFSSPAEVNSNRHNSYFEVLFGAGVPLFCYFLICFVIRPCVNFYRLLSDKYIFLIPVVIIPYFESNLTGGQFLFFPWFILVILTGDLMNARIAEVLNKQRHGKFPRPV